MDKVGAASIATVVAGGLIALQPPIVAQLGDSIGTLEAAAVNFVVGAALLVVLALIFGGGFGDLHSASGLSWYHWVGGGLVGAAYVTTVIITVGSLGAAGVTAATVAGQLTASIVIDRAGVLGLTQRAITPGRVVGIAFLAVGVALVVRR
jgi:bacterial/archaeal transporter family-2 protein